MKIAVGISGGVDSAVAALLLKRGGHSLTGVTMTLGRADEEKSLAEARAVAARLGIELKVYDFSADWREKVLAYVKSEYLAARTPNPCVRCNETVKMKLLPEFAFRELGAEVFATGHYARLEGGRLFRGKDPGKDQSYFLYRVPSAIRERTQLPLGGLTKREVREIAREAGFEAAEREDSQDFCGGDVKTLVGLEPREGKIITSAGKVLGTHPGYWNYTVGKRKGLGIGGGIPYYVLKLNAARNEVVVGFKEELLETRLELKETLGRIDFSLPVKVRSAGEPKLLSEGIAGIAAGQSAVFYEGEEVVGGGIIA